MRARKESWIYTPHKLADELDRSRGRSIALDLPKRKPLHAHCEGCGRYVFAGRIVNKGWRCAGCREERKAS